MKPPGNRALGSPDSLRRVSPRASYISSQCRGRSTALFPLVLARLALSCHSGGREGAARCCTRVQVAVVESLSASATYDTSSLIVDIDIVTSTL